MAQRGTDALDPVPVPLSHEPVLAILLELFGKSTQAVAVVVVNRLQRDRLDSFEQQRDDVDVISAGARNRIEGRQSERQNRVARRDHAQGARVIEAVAGGTAAPRGMAQGLNHPVDGFGRGERIIDSGRESTQGDLKKLPQ